MWVAALGVVGGAAAWYYQSVGGTSGVKAAAKRATGNATFKGGDQGFIDLKLESVENVNHNTRKLRFALPDEGDVSGLKVACTSLCRDKEARG